MCLFQVALKGRSLSAKGVGGRRTLNPIIGSKYGGLYGGRLMGMFSSKSAGYNGLFLRGKHHPPEPPGPSWRDEYVGKRVWIDNYSWV